MAKGLARSYGYRNTDNFINMLYLLCGKLKFDYPLKSTWTLNMRISPDMIYSGKQQLSFIAIIVLLLISAGSAPADSRSGEDGGDKEQETMLSIVDRVSRQHLEEQARRIVESLELLGTPMKDQDRQKIATADESSDEKAIKLIQSVLDPYCLIGVYIDEEAWLKVIPARSDFKDRSLTQYNWQTFLVKVHNRGYVRTPLDISSPQFLMPEEVVTAAIVEVGEDNDSDDWYRWISIKEYNDSPMQKPLSGERLDYRIIQVYSRDSGIRAADFKVNLGGGQVARGHYAEVSLLFQINEPE